jgi:alkylation response protein AidB-like acyl-CoA dehydrogenase
VTEPDDTPEEAAFRARIHADLEARLQRRDDGAAWSVMGAGSDDLETGRKFLAALADGGYAVPSWPVEQGGMGATAEQAGIVAQELARFEAPDLYPFMIGVSLVGPTLMTHGNASQLGRWLSKIRSGEEIWCQLFSEPDAGSDLAGLTSRAERDGDMWRITGTKVWNSRAHYADWGLLLARSDSSVPKHAGITAFAIRMDALGVEIRPVRQMNGDTHFNEVFLDDAPVPDTDRIASVGDGWRVAITTLMHERGSIAGRTGISRSQLLELGRAHEVTAAPVARDRLVRSVTALEIGRLTALRARAGGQSGQTPGPEGSGGKLRMSEALKAIGNLALDLEGPAGVAGEAAGAEDPWQTLFLTGPSLSIRGGTDEIQRNILGERVLGLPAEPRADKDRPFSDRPR